MVTINNTNSANNYECPVIIIGERHLPACSIRIVLHGLKYTIIIRYIVWSIMAL